MGWGTRYCSWTDAAIYIRYLLFESTVHHIIACAGAAARQPSIMHMTLARVLRVQQLTPEQRQSIQEACSLWTDKLRGQVFRPEVLT